MYIEAGQLKAWVDVVYFLVDMLDRELWRMSDLVENEDWLLTQIEIAVEDSDDELRQLTPQDSQYQFLLGRLAGQIVQQHEQTEEVNFLKGQLRIGEEIINAWNATARALQEFEELQAAHQKKKEVGQ